MTGLEGFVRASGAVMGHVRESFGPGGDVALAPPNLNPAPGAPVSSGRAADASVTDAGRVHTDVVALDAHDSSGVEQLIGAASASGVGRARMDAVIAAAVADVNAMGMSTNTPTGRDELIKAIKHHLEDTQSTLQSARGDATTRAAGSTANTAGYNATAPGMNAVPQMSSMLGSGMSGLSGVATAPASMMSGLPLGSLMGALGGAAPASWGTDPGGSGDPVTGQTGLLSGDSTVADGAARRALSQLGKPYVWGATGPSAFDCSGLTQWAYHGVGVDLPHHTYEQMQVGQQVPPGQARAGDLVFSEFLSGPGRPEHVQMAIGNGQVVEAQMSGVPVKVSPMPSGDVVVKRVVSA